MSSCRPASTSTPASARSTRCRSTSSGGGCRSCSGARSRPRQDAHVLICKGAVEEVFAVCTQYEIGDQIGPLDASHFATAKETTAALNADGFRVVAVAFKEMPPAQATYSVADEADLTLLGYIAFLDPPKETAAAALATLKAARRRMKILTGDNDIVTRKICHEVGLPVERIVLGGEIETLSPDALADLAENAAVFAKSRRPRRPRSSMRCTARGTWSASGRRHQRRPGAEGRRRRHLGRYRGRHRQGIGRHHPAGEEPAGARRRRARGPQGLRQHHQVHQDGRQLELRQHVQRARRQHLPAVPADGADPGAHQQPALRLLADHHPDRQCRRRVPAVPRQWDIGNITKFMLSSGRSARSSTT